MGEPRSKQPEEQLGNAGHRFLNLPQWQGIGALATILGVIVAILIALLQQGLTHAQGQKSCVSAK
ncbi:hypothetical protein [Nonomuraea sp. SYSU D8015]|uniref:hypothetical protein n=1 Tax=Nonomuraea sp. SYSU D8015 TaxID=2593644 RepID=UPI001660F00A|nr:hypothetical protein [Nonomuraea sp. SYSU D8015]